MRPLIYGLSSGGGRVAYLIGSDGQPTGHPVLPVISPGLRDALAAQPATAAGSAVVWWTPYDAVALRSVIDYGVACGFPPFASSLFQSYEIQVLPASQSSLPGVVYPTRATAPAALADLSKIALGVNFDLKIGSVSSSGFDFFRFTSNAFADRDFASTQPSMRASHALDNFLRQQNLTLNSSNLNPTVEVYCLPGEALSLPDRFSVGQNPVWDPADNSDSGSDSESAAESLKRIADSIAKLVQLFEDAPDESEDKLPGGNLFEKLRQLLNLIADLSEIWSNFGVPGIRDLLPNFSQLLTDAEKLQALKDALGLVLTPFLGRLADALLEREQSERDFDSGSDSISNIQVDFTEFWNKFLVEAWNSDSNSESAYSALLRRLNEVFPVAVSQIYGYEFFNR